MKRNRVLTEDRIVQAAMRMVSQQGFADFGINHLAAHAAVDKVLIYRYFGGVDGVLEGVATGAELLPEPASLPDGTLSGFIANLNHWLRLHPLSVQLSLWAGVVDNPLTAAFGRCRNVFWEDSFHLLKPRDEASASFLRMLPLLPLPLPVDPVWDKLLVTLAFDVPYARGSDGHPGADQETMAASSPYAAADTLPTELL